MVFGEPVVLWAFACTLSGLCSLYLECMRDIAPDNLPVGWEHSCAAFGGGGGTGFPPGGPMLWHLGLLEFVQPQGFVPKVVENRGGGRGQRLAAMRVACHRSYGTLRTTV